MKLIQISDYVEIPGDKKAFQAAREITNLETSIDNDRFITHHFQQRGQLK